MFASEARRCFLGPAVLLVLLGGAGDEGEFGFDRDPALEGFVVPLPPFLRAGLLSLDGG